MLRSLFACLLLLVAPACAQTSSTGEDGRLPDTYSEAEQAVWDVIREDGLHIVHFWAPWCHNSRGEFAERWWPAFVADHEDVSVSFVTVRNGGEVGDEMLDRFDIPARVLRLAHPGPHRYDEPDDAPRPTFLGRPVDWTPTTWIFHRNGSLAYAINYGEVTPELLTTLLEHARQDWAH